jgi:hypothetical protein
MQYKILECKNGNEKPVRSLVSDGRTTVHSSNWNYTSVCKKSYTSMATLRCTCTSMG